MKYHDSHINLIRDKNEVVCLFGIACGRVSYAPEYKYLYSFRLFLGLVKIEFLWKTGKLSSGSKENDKDSHANKDSSSTPARQSHWLLRLVRDTPWGVILALIFGGYLNVGCGIARGFDYGSMLVGGVILFYALVALITLRPILSSNSREDS
jgi:hypothetical protein